VGELLALYGYRKIIVVKMVFVTMFGVGQGTNLGAKWYQILGF